MYDKLQSEPRERALVCPVLQVTIADEVQDKWSGKVETNSLRNRRLHCSASHQTHSNGGLQKISVHATQKCKTSFRPNHMKPKKIEALGKDGDTNVHSRVAERS